MKHITRIIALALILALLPVASLGSSSLIKLEDFVFNFNFLSAFFDNGCELSLDNVYSFEKVGNVYLYKTIFNDCEILTLTLADTATDIKTVTCTWQHYPNGSGYGEHFVEMLSIIFSSCDMPSDSLSTFYAEFNTFNVGDTGEMLLDGVKVSYNVSSFYISYELEFDPD